MPRTRRGEAISLVCLVDLIDRSIRFSRFAARVAPREESLYARGGLPWARIRPSTASPHIGARRPLAGRAAPLPRPPGAETQGGPAPPGAGPPLDASCEMRVVGQRRPALPRAYPAVPSALGGLTSGFGMGPGLPPLSWSLTGDGHSCPSGRALRAAQRDYQTIPNPAPRPSACD